MPEQGRAPAAVHGGGAPPRTPPPAPPAPPPPSPFAAAPDDTITGIPAYGTLIQVQSDPGPPAVFVNIEGVGDITGPGTNIAEAETTSHSTGAPVRSFIPTLIDPGELSFPCFWNPSDPTQSLSSPYGLESLFWSRSITTFQLVNTDPTHRTRQFRGFVKSIAETAPVAGIMTRNTAIRITSPMMDVPSAISLEPDNATALTAGGPGTFDVKTGGSNAPWQAQSGVPWITIDDPVGLQTGDQTVNYTVASNGTGSPRTGHILIAALSLSFTVTQS